jgi:hypothetical protein
MNYLNKNLNVVGNTEEIDDLEDKLFEGFKSISDMCVHGIVGFRGGNDIGDIYWSSDLGIWFFSKKFDDVYWNAFGIHEPVEGNNTITCEINLLRLEISQRRAGAFVKDENGEYYLVHSGNIGGGRKGFGKKLFFEKYEGQITDAIYNDKKNQVAVIGKLSDPNFYIELKNFVYQIKKMKDI